MQDNLYSIPEQVRRYSIDTSSFYPPQSLPFPNYCAEPVSDYFAQGIPAGRSRILSFSDEKKKKGDVMDFYVKYKTEVILSHNWSCARTGKRTDTANLTSDVPLRTESTSWGRRLTSRLATRQRSAKASTKAASVLTALAASFFTMRSWVTSRRFCESVDGKGRFRTLKRSSCWEVTNPQWNRKRR